MSNTGIIQWSKNYLLDWSDFQAESNPAVFEDAHSSIKYHYTWTVGSESFGNNIQFFIENIQLYSEFRRHLSWVRLPMASPSLLNHEQGHFDLAEFLLPSLTERIQRLFKNKFYPTRGKNEEQRKQSAREDSGLMIAREIKNIEDYLHKKQQEYDIETEYGQNTKKQNSYDIKFKTLRTGI